MNNYKQDGISKDTTPEAYNEYFEKYPSDIRRAEYRAKKGIKLLGNIRGKALSIGVGNLGEFNTIKSAGFDVDICDISPLAVEFAINKGFSAFVCDITKDIPQKNMMLFFVWKFWNTLLIL